MKKACPILYAKLLLESQHYRKPDDPIYANIDYRCQILQVECLGEHCDWYQNSCPAHLSKKSSSLEEVNKV